MHKNSLDYPVEFVQDAFGESDALAKMLAGVTGAQSPRVLIVADQNVAQRTDGLGTKIGRYVRAHGISLAGNPVVIGGGEKAKLDDMQSALRVASAILANRLGRRDAVLVIGGGSVMDAACWAASQAGGGVPVVRVPTTPEAMIDAAFAEYAAIDSSAVKDAMRVKASPAGVVVDTMFAQTVLDGVWRGGVGEAVRLGLARDASLLKKLLPLAGAYRNRDAKTLDEVVALAYAARTKKGATTFALWSAMRLQEMSGWKLPHGYAVSIGVLVDLSYAVAAGVVKAEVRDSVIGFFAECGTLDGLVHSQYLLQQADSLLEGVADWRRASPDGTVEVLSGVGKTKGVDGLDEAVFKESLKYLVSLPSKR